MTKHAIFDALQTLSKAVVEDNDLTDVELMRIHKSMLTIREVLVDS